MALHTVKMDLFGSVNVINCYPQECLGASPKGTPGSVKLTINTNHQFQRTQKSSIHLLQLASQPQGSPDCLSIIGIIGSFPHSPKFLICFLGSELLLSHLKARALYTESSLQHSNIYLTIIVQLLPNPKTLNRPQIVTVINENM